MSLTRGLGVVAFVWGCAALVASLFAEVAVLAGWSLLPDQPAGFLAVWGPQLVFLWIGMTPSLLARRPVVRVTPFRIRAARLSLLSAFIQSLALIGRVLWVRPVTEGAQVAALELTIASLAVFSSLMIVWSWGLCWHPYRRSSEMTTSRE
jgi:hypothetical protein